MLLDGLELLGATDAVNFAVDSGVELSLTGKIGQLFFLYGDEETTGLHVFTGSEWRRVGSTEFKIIAGNGINYDEETGEISTNIPVNATENQILATKNGSLVWVTFTKQDVGLENVDNTSDANKPISIAAQNALDQKVDKNNPVFEGTITGISKESVGLGNVNNTSDADKPISNATQDALDLKANIESPTFTGVVGGITKAMVGLGNADNTTDLDKPISTSTQAALNLKADKTYVNNQLDLKVDQTEFDTTADALQSNIDSLGEYVDDELALKADTGYVTNQLIFKADKVFVDTELALKADQTYVDSELAQKASTSYVDGEVTDLTAYIDAEVDQTNANVTSGINSAFAAAEKLANKNVANGYVGLGSDLKIDPQYLPETTGGGAVTSVNTQTGDVVLNKTHIGLANVDNTSDANKPVSTATQTALNLKAPTASPTFTGSPSVSGSALLYSGMSGNFDLNAIVTQRVSSTNPTSLTINPMLGHHITKTVNTTGTAFFSITPTGIPSGSFTFILEIVVTNIGTASWPANVYWPANVSPVLGAGKTHLIMFNTINSGTTWHGATLTGYTA